MADVTDQFYPAEGKFHGYGTQFMVGDDTSPPNFEALAEVTNIALGRMTTAAFDRTHLRSPNAHREKLAGMRDSEAITLQLNWRPKHESQSNTGGGSGSFAAGGLLHFCITRATKTWKLVCTDESPATEVEIEAFVSAYQIGPIGVDDGPGLTVELTPLDGSWHSDLP
jgi:hypothetical protein